MLCPLQHLRRAAGLLLLSLGLLTQCRLQVAAGPLPVGDEARPGETPPPRAPALPVSPVGPEAARRESEAARDLFQDVDPKALAALLLQALQPEPVTPESSERHPGSPPEAHHAERGPSQRPRPEEEEEASRPSQQGQPESLRPVAAKRDNSKQVVPRELAVSEERLKKAPSKRRAAPAGREEEAEEEPWDGARKLRQQQHLEHQLLQRRYEELAESRRQAEEARRAAAEEERLADMASDLLLQYLLKDGDEEEEEEEEEEEGRSEEEEGEGSRRRGGSALLFEDEEAAGNVAEDKRSNEAPEEEEEEEEEGGDDLDPNTIDRLIELSSKLHLPADDVIDIINDVGEQKKKKAAAKKKKADAAPLPAGGRNGKAGAAAPPRSSSKANKRPAPDPSGPQPASWGLPKPYYAPAYYKPPSRRPKPEEAAWNEVLKGDEYPYPGGKGWPKISNAISRWTIPAHPAPQPLRRLPPGPAVAPRGAEEEEQGGGRPGKGGLEDYLETLLGKHRHFF